jgi:hypothetical protein
VTKISNAYFQARPTSYGVRPKYYAPYIQRALQLFWQTFPDSEWPADAGYEGHFFYAVHCIPSARDEYGVRG